MLPQFKFWVCCWLVGLAFRRQTTLEKILELQCSQSSTKVNICRSNKFQLLTSLSAVWVCSWFFFVLCQWRLIRGSTAAEKRPAYYAGNLIYSRFGLVRLLLTSEMSKLSISSIFLIYVLKLTIIGLCSQIRKNFWSWSDRYTMAYLLCSFTINKSHSPIWRDLMYSRYGHNSMNKKDYYLSSEQRTLQWSCQVPGSSFFPLTF